MNLLERITRQIKFHAHTRRSKRSSQNGERLTTDEVCHMLSEDRPNVWRCCDCPTGLLLWGPSGGVQQMTVCDHCHSEFMVMATGRTPIVERISMPGPRQIEPGRWCHHFFQPS